MAEKRSPTMDLLLRIGATILEILLIIGVVAMVLFL